MRVPVGGASRRLFTTDRKLTEAQRACLSKLAETPAEPYGGWRIYGVACGVKRNVVRALEARGLAQAEDKVIIGVCARATDAGRRALQELDQ